MPTSSTTGLWKSLYHHSYYHHNLEVSKLESIDSNETGKYCDQVRYLQKKMALKYGNVTRSGPKESNETTPHETTLRFIFAKKKNGFIFQ